MTSKQASKKSTVVTPDITLPKSKKTTVEPPAASVTEVPVVTAKVDKKINKYDEAVQILLTLLESNNIEVPAKFFRSVPKTSRHSVFVKKEEGEPKKAQTAYNYFCNDKYNQARTKGERMPEFGQLAAIWKEYTDADKQPFKKLQGEDKERYIRERTSWDLVHPKPVTEKKSRSRKAVKIADTVPTPPVVEVSVKAPKKARAKKSVDVVAEGVTA